MQVLQVLCSTPMRLVGSGLVIDSLRTHVEIKVKANHSEARTREPYGVPDYAHICYFPE